MDETCEIICFIKHNIAQVYSNSSVFTPSIYLRVSFVKVELHAYISPACMILTEFEAIFFFVNIGHARPTYSIDPYGFLASRLTSAQIIIYMQ